MFAACTQLCHWFQVTCMHTHLCRYTPGFCRRLHTALPVVPVVQVGGAQPLRSDGHVMNSDLIHQRLIYLMPARKDFKSHKRFFV